MTGQKESIDLSAAGNGIGTLNERSLHAALKLWYALPADRFEVPLQGFVIDVVRGEQLIEIQTRNFTSIRQKLKTLLKHYRVHLLHPVTFEKWIVQVDHHRVGQVLSRRKSPVKGQLTDLFAELVRIPELVKHPNFSLEILLTREEEVRCQDGKGSWRRRRTSVLDRRLLEVVNTHRFTDITDFLQFLPSTLPIPFSNKCLAAANGLPLYRCRQLTYCLRKMELIVQVGKRGNELLYEILLPANLLGSVS